jgi:hypothetical protein
VKIDVAHERPLRGGISRGVGSGGSRVMNFKTGRLTFGRGPSRMKARSRAIAPAMPARDSMLRLTRGFNPGAGAR